MKNKIPEILAVLLLIVAILGVAHQRLTTTDRWFHWSQLYNHESIVAILVFGAIGLVAGKYLGKSRDDV